VLICEGYATGASIHMATGLPVAIAFDCGNLQPVAEILHKRYRDARILICADDDFLTDGNPGISKASAAALAVDGAWLAPVFSQERERNLTDFNDLRALEGTATVRSQFEAKFAALQWSSRAGPSARQPDGAEGGAAALFVPRDVNDLLAHFVKIYGSEMVWDERNRMIVKLAALRTDVTNKESVREWQASPARRFVSADRIGFDPTGADPAVECNLWAGFQTKPVSGCCERLLELLRYLCGNEDNADEVYDWILKWLAYPLQHPGAKMQTALLMHGEEGSGKNLFFGAVRAIYGRYGGNINQDDLEDKFNDWASAKIFIIANEVVTRVELYHVQGKLKNMITETEWQINPKNMPRRQEQNHCNFVFFSNRVDIAKLDKRDRRYSVVWTPGPLGAEFYGEVAAELKAGGVAALHDHLLNIDLGDFTPHTKPPDTRAKRDLIDLGLDNTERFYGQWIAEDLGLPVAPCISEDLYAAYKRWAGINGIQKCAPSHIFLATIGKRDDVCKRREEIWDGSGKRWRTMIHPGGHWDCPMDKRKLDWLSDAARSFADAVMEMKSL
jgi:putative DNA primase/helicase